MLLELHSHTHYSKGTKVIVEGLNSPLEMLKHAKKIGLDGIAITDHRTVRGALASKKLAKKVGITVIPGVELSSTRGDIIALGVTEEIKNNMSVAETVEAIHDLGGISVAPHAFDIKGAGIGKECKKTDVVEVFNALNLDRIGNMKCARFAHNNKKPACVGSDAHCVEMLGHSTVEVEADSEDDILRELKKGRAKLNTQYIPIAMTTDWAVKRLKLSQDYVIKYIDRKYSNPKKAIAKKMLKLVNKSPGKIDYFFHALGYFAIGNAFLYGAAKSLSGR